MTKITKPNVNNLSPKYWEKVLESHGLGIDQPITDNSDEPGAPQTSEPTGKVTKSSARSARVTCGDSEFLRQIVDGNDPLMTHASIMKVRTKDREIPEWALNDTRVREILLRSFPKLNTNEKQRSKAARWYSIIYLYYRMRQPRQVIKKELKITEENLNHFIQRISFVAAGLNTLGKPRKKISSPQTPLEGTRRKGNGEKIKNPHLLVSADGGGRKTTA